MLMWILFEAVWVCCSFGRVAVFQCSHLHTGSLSCNKIGDAGAQDLGAALRVNTTLTTL
jgi:hypothetical protein